MESEDDDTIAKHVAKQFAQRHTTEQTNLRITVKIEEQGIDESYRVMEEYANVVVLPIDMRDSFVSRLNQYLTTT